MPTSLEKLVINRFAYVNLMGRVGGSMPGSEKYTQLLVDSVSQILAAYKTVKTLSVEDALEIQKVVADGPLPKEQKATLMDALTGKVPQLRNNANASAKKVDLEDDTMAV